MPRPEGPPDLPSGLVLLQRYTITARVTSGGMATIYRARDERLERDVCVKLLRLLLDAGATARGRKVYKATYSHFLQEALALSKLQHPNTLRIYDFGYLEDSGRPFQIAEFLEGGTLEDRIKRSGAISPVDTLAILEPIASAVEEAHSHAIIHRDIKPSNILFAKVGEALIPKLADFGIAHSNLKKKDDDDDGWPDETEHVSTVALFSPRWAAPEQLAGIVQGPSTDVHALGLVAYYMLVGKPIFEGKDIRATFAERIRGDEFVRGLLATSNLSPPIQAVLLASLAAFPERRPPRPAAFLSLLRAAVAAGASTGLLPPNAVRPPRESAWPSAPPRPRSSASEGPPGGASQPALPPIPAPPPLPRAWGPPPPPPVSSASGSAGLGGSEDLLEHPHQRGSENLLEHPHQRGSENPLESSGERGTAPEFRPPPKAHPPERIRFVEVVESLDLTVTSRATPGGPPPYPPEAVLRISLVPSPHGGSNLHVRGLNCLVSKTGGRPVPAFVATADGEAELLSASRGVIGTVRFWMGDREGDGEGHVRFRRKPEDLVVRLPGVAEAVALDLGPDHELVVMCRR